jgi:hypothetical protein
MIDNEKQGLINISFQENSREERKQFVKESL